MASEGLRRSVRTSPDQVQRPLPSVHLRRGLHGRCRVEPGVPVSCHRTATDDGRDAAGEKTDGDSHRCRISFVAVGIQNRTAVRAPVRWSSERRTRSNNPQPPAQCGKTNGSLVRFAMCPRTSGSGDAPIRHPQRKVATSEEKMGPGRRRRPDGRRRSVTTVFLVEDGDDWTRLFHINSSTVTKPAAPPFRTKKGGGEPVVVRLVEATL